MKILSRIFVSVMCLICGTSLSAQDSELTSSEKHAIRAFVNDVKYARKELVANAISYPLSRIYPLEPIRSAEEFIAHYDEFIDSSLIDSLVNTSWYRFGWRGITCNAHVQLWGVVGEDGEFRVYSFGLNDKGKERWQESVEKQRGLLHPSLREFDVPEYMIKAGKYIVRIDRMADETYRYASWSGSKSISSNPDLIIYGGTLEVIGTIHEYHYSFTNGEYEYQVVGGGPWEYPFELCVLRGDKELLSREGELYY